MTNTRREVIQLVPHHEPAMPGMRPVPAHKSQVSENWADPDIRTVKLGDTATRPRADSGAALTQMDLDRVPEGSKRGLRGLGLIRLWQRRVD
jgi:hypothetical protein